MPIQSLNTNSSAMSSRRYIGINGENVSIYQEQLATGSRVSDPSRDASSAAVGYLLDGTLQILGQASTNANQAMSLIGLASGTLGSMINNVNKMASLAAQSNSDSISDAQRTLINEEYQARLAQLDQIAKVTWSGVELFTGGASGLTQTGAVNTSIQGTGTISGNAVGAITGLNATLSTGFIGGGVSDVIVTDSGVNQYSISIKVGGQTFQGVATTGANQNAGITLVSTIDATNKIVFDTANANAVNLNSASSYRSALQNYLGITSGAPASIISPSSAPAFSFAVGAGMKQGLWGVSYTYDTNTNQGVLKLTNGNEFFTTAVSDTNMSNITSGTFYMDNGFSVTVTNFNALTSRAMTTMDVASATSFDRTFQIGQKATDTISLTFQGLTTANLNLAGTSISTRNNAIAVFPVISAAVNTINLQIAQFGGKRAQLEVASRNLDLSIQNQSLAKATFTDTDIPSALMELQKNKGLYDASTAMLQNTVHKYNELADLILRTTR